MLHLADRRTVPPLRTDRLLLRALSDADRPDLAAIFSDEEVCRYFAVDTFTGPSDADAFMRTVREGFADWSLLQWGLVKRDSGLLIGTGAIAGWDASAGTAEIGYAIRRDHWGEGYATEAAERLARFAFDELGLARLVAEVDTRNPASARVAMRCGFVRAEVQGEDEIWHLSRERYHRRHA